MITDTQIEHTVAIARDYLADRRLPPPRAHDLAVALVAMYDTLAEGLPQMEANLARAERAIDQTVVTLQPLAAIADQLAGAAAARTTPPDLQQQMQQLWTAAGLVFGAEQLAMALVILRQGGSYQVLHGGTIRGQVAADVLEEQVKSLRGGVA